jgi:hypothetical protein
MYDFGRGLVIGIGLSFICWALVSLTIELVA